MIDKDDPASIWWGDTEALTEAIKALSLDINKNQKGDMNMTSEVKVTIEHEDGHKQELNGDTIICFTVSKAGEFLDGKAQIIDAQAAFIGRAIPDPIYPLFNSKWWGVPQNRERYIVIGIRDTLEGAYRYPTEQHEWIPKLSSVLEKDVPESFYIDDEKAQKIIDQALQRLAKMGNVHATITPDREVKRQNGRRAKEDEEEMFTLTAQDLHGVIQRQGKELVQPGDTCASALIHSRGLETRHDGISHCVKGGGGGSGANFLVEKVPPPITEVCVNDRGFTEKDPQVSSVAPTLRAENHGNHPKVIEERSTPPKSLKEP